jgi:DNA-binding response OmpR family regulator
MLVCDILRQNGYTVLQARDGREALNTCEGYKGTIDLMVTDVVMPVMGARELAGKLNSLHPETRVLCISGYTDDAIVRDGRLAPGTAYLAKPFTPSALLAKVREVLDVREEGINPRPAR